MRILFVMPSSCSIAKLAWILLATERGISNWVIKGLGHLRGSTIICKFQNLFNSNNFHSNYFMVIIFDLIVSQKIRLIWCYCECLRVVQPLKKNTIQPSTNINFILTTEQWKIFDSCFCYRQSSILKGWKQPPKLGVENLFSEISQEPLEVEQIFFNTNSCSKNKNRFMLDAQSHFIGGKGGGRRRFPRRETYY